MSASFFPNGEAILATSMTVFRPNGSKASREIAGKIGVIDLLDKSTQEYPVPGFSSYLPVTSGELVSVGRVNGRSFMSRTTLANMSEVVRIWLNEEAMALVASGNRQRLLHRVGRDIVCRRSKDLQVEWSRPIDDHLIAARARFAPRAGPMGVHYDISFDGSTVLAGVLNGYGATAEAGGCVEILDGATGVLRATAFFPAASGVRLSHDGGILATGHATASGNKREAWVSLRRSSSGAEFARMSHESVSERIWSGGLVASGLEFSGDGRYLATSTSSRVKIWSL